MFVFVSLSYHLKLSYAGTNMNLEIALNIQKIPVLSNFPTQKNLGIENSTPPPPKTSLDQPHHLKSGVAPPPPVCVFRSFLDYIQILDANYCFLLLSVFTVFFAV